MMAHQSASGASSSVVGVFGGHGNSKQFAASSGANGKNSLQNPQFPVAQRYIGRQPVRMNGQIPRINKQSEVLVGNIEESSQEFDCAAPATTS